MKRGKTTRGRAAFKKDEQSKIITKTRTTLRTAQKIRDTTKTNKKVIEDRIEK